MESALLLSSRRDLLLYPKLFDSLLKTSAKPRITSTKPPSTSAKSAFQTR